MRFVRQLRLDDPRRRLLLVGLLVIAAAVLCLLAATGMRHLIDLGVYLYGGDEVRAGRSPYAEREPVANLPFTYPPVAGYLFAPLAALPTWLAVVLWLGLVVTAAAVAFAVLLQAPDGRWPEPLVLVGVTAAAFVTEPFFATFGYGQVNTVLLAMVLVDTVLVRRGSRWAGVLTGIAAAVKLTPAIFVLYWLLTGRRRPAGVATATFALATVLPLVAGRPWASGYWTDGVSDPSRLGYVRGAGNQSLLGLVGRTWVDRAESPTLRFVLFGLAVVAGLALAYRLWRLGRDDLGFAVAAVTGLLATPASWDHHYVWLVPLLAAMLLREAPPRWRTAAVVAIAVLLVCPPRRVDFDPRDLTAPTPLTGLLLGAYTLLAVALLVLVWLDTREAQGRAQLGADPTRDTAAAPR